MKTYHQLMESFAKQRVQNEVRTMHRINIAILHGWGIGTKGSHVPAAHRHYERCRKRMLESMMTAVYHSYMIATESNLGI